MHMYSGMLTMPHSNSKWSEWRLYALISAKPSSSDCAWQKGLVTPAIEINRNQKYFPILQKLQEGQHVSRRTVDSTLHTY